jgi:hypothetical protein
MFALLNFANEPPIVYPYFSPPPHSKPPTNHTTPPLLASARIIDSFNFGKVDGKKHKLELEWE